MKYYYLQTLDLKLTGAADNSVGFMKSLKRIYLERPDDSEDSHEFITDEFILSMVEEEWCALETLVVRNYPRVTDVSLIHAEEYLRSLKYLDLSGSTCSAEEAAVVRKNRPEVVLTV